MHITERRWRRLAAVAAALLIAVLPANPAQAEPGGIIIPESSIDQSVIVLDAIAAHGLSEEEVALLKRQEALNAVAAQITESSEHDASDGSGLAGLVTVPDANELKVYWHGALPASVEQYIKDARNGDMKVTVTAAPYTENELLAEIDRITELPLHDGAPTGQRSMIAVPAHDGTAIEVQVGGLPARTTAEAALGLVPALESDYPLSVTLIDAVEPTVRFVDFPPYAGGALITRGGTSCSSAFGVTGNNGAATYMLTAAHCGEGTWRTGRVVTSNGSVYQNTLGNTIPTRDLAHDGQAILTPAGSSPYVYVGAGINPDNGDLGSNTVVQVAGASYTTNGNRVCNGGSYSGTICSIEVVATVATVTYDPPVNGVGRMTNMGIAQRLGSAAVGNGDSGGPVYMPNSNGTVIANGIVSGQILGPGHDAACVGWAPPGRECSSTMIYGHLPDIMGRIGVHINT